MALSSTISSIYTDGACSGNPGPGGWGTVVYFKDGSVHELGGGATDTTNNRMEMQAAIAALEFLASNHQSIPVILYTDSKYVKNGITQWIKGWKRKGWKTSSGKPVLNQDLWEKLDNLNHQLANQTPLEWQYVKGHAGNIGNERCDQIARAFATGTPISLKQIPNSPSVAETIISPSIPISTAALEPDSTSDGSKDKSVEKSPHDRLDLPIAAINKVTSSEQNITIQSRGNTENSESSDPAMVDPRPESSMDASADLPRDVVTVQLRHVVETLRMADEVANQGYLITSSELAALMDIHAGAVTSRGNNWVWRNWMVSRVRREGNQILWQLERID